MKAIDATIIFAISTLGVFLQLKYQPKKVSPFHTHYVTMIFFSITFTIYVVAMIIDEGISWVQSSSLATVIISKLSFFSGTLASILLMQILVSVLGWSLFVLWTIFFLKIFLIELSRILVFRQVLRWVFLKTWRQRAMQGRLVQEQNRLPPVQPDVDDLV